VFAFFIQILNRRLVDHQVRSLGAVYFNAVLVIPLNNAVDFLIIAEHDDHWSLGLHLFLVVEILSVGLLGRRNLTLSAAPIAVPPAFPTTTFSAFRTLTPFPTTATLAAMTMIIAGQGRTNQLAIAEVLRFSRTLCGCGI